MLQWYDGDLCERVCVCLVKDGTLQISSQLICIDFSTCLLMFATQWDATANFLHVKSATFSITERFPNQYTQQRDFFVFDDVTKTMEGQYKLFIFTVAARFESERNIM